MILLPISPLSVLWNTQLGFSSILTIICRLTYLILNRHCPVKKKTSFKIPHEITNFVLFYEETHFKAIITTFMRVITMALQSGGYWTDQNSK